jgi:ABC-type glycerol-3-phosphate transport system substrate-binding protein
MVSRKISRRRLMAGSAMATAMVAAPFVRGAHAAGKLSMGFWDHWVPGANAATEKAVRAWAEKEKVEVSIDFITSQGNKLLLTGAAESQAKSGHDILALSTWLPSRYADQLVSMDDVMADLIKDTARSIRPSSISAGSRASGSACRRRSAARSRDRARASTT